MDTKDAPQLIEHINQSLTFTPFDTKWIPSSARFVLVGQTPKATGVMNICQLNKGKLDIVASYDRPYGIKCCTFGASSVSERTVACGDYNGYLTIYDIETGKPIYHTKAHDQIINSIDGVGGKGIETGAPEIVTGSRDGCVTVWDPRQEGKIVSLEPAEKGEVFPDCWAVCFGNSYNSEERVLAAGYDNGDLKVFDLKQNMLIWDTNLKNAVCGLEFDRKDVQMNKLVATTLESKCHVFDMKTFHPDLGFAAVTELPQKSTIWGAKHLPHNRDIFMTLAGNGGLNLYKYNYPAKRMIKDENNLSKGVPGTLTLLNELVISTQPVASFDWSPDKIGLACLSCLDQTCKIMIVTKLNTF